MSEGIVVSFEEAKAGLEIPKSPQYRAYSRVKQVLAEEDCDLIIVAGLEQIAPDVYKLFARPKFVYKGEKSEQKERGL